MIRRPSELVRRRHPVAGGALGLTFFFFQAPDVALSQITVGAVALPLMVMLAISRMKFRSASSPPAKEDKHD
jgi:multisubunit Na+/H+ antiporter MnhB subunit